MTLTQPGAGPETAASAPTAAAPERFRHLDGLRGVAAFVVLVYHGVLVVPHFANPEWLIPKAGGWGWFDYSPLRVVLAGTEAVMIFFVLSGFVLTLPVLRRAKFSWRAYYGSRILRLYLPVFGALVWAAIVITVFSRHGLTHDPSPYLRAHPEDPTALKLARDGLLVDGVNSLDDPLWSLQWEVLFSLLLPLYVVLAVRLKRWWLQLVFVVAALAAVGAVSNHPSLEYLPAFAIGALFATALPRLQDAIGRINGSARHRVTWSVLTVVAVLLLTARWTIGPRLPAHLLGATQFPVLIGAALFVFIALGSAVAKHLLTLRAVQWLGMISFSLYLTHEPIVIAVAQLLPRSAEGAAVFIATPVSLAFGWLFYRIVEKPAHRLSQVVKRKLTPVAH
ncbi:hypothetical protein AX769_01480 [Frondihabitans sp. PAMC 28766]|uniref:acyltransferase family protein n=1 Tax=Frondihabitans sp. PAMC 28766 TaxID=1795630 RepID=UPI00078C10D2|nr:acyltransferase [Frondihabitans sp. PAMC 28766]AMM19051.1 hypothetical protein AX769_01480 [Frondihabitans sp. PAMC 28766]